MEKKEKTLEVITRVLEEAAFVFTDTLSADDLPDPSTWEVSGVSLQFFGEENGVMRMWASEGFARCVAANMLGVSEDDESAGDKGLDALKESLNIIVGNYLTAMYGEEPVFDLGLPEPIDTALLTEDFNNPASVLLSADDHPILFVVEINGNQPND